jgi:hypothetical protein
LILQKNVGQPLEASGRTPSLVRKISLIVTLIVYFNYGLPKNFLSPCFDEPEYKATYSIRLYHPLETQALSNMPALVKGFKYIFSLKLSFKKSHTDTF